LRKINACTRIMAPVQAVQQIAERACAQWLDTRRGLLVSTLKQSWNASPLDDGATQFTLRMEYAARIPFLEITMVDGMHDRITRSLVLLKQLAEATPP
jgi:hypothetical protein